jgi:hypothetical protein
VFVVGVFRSRIHVHIGLRRLEIRAQPTLTGRSDPPRQGSGRLRVESMSIRARLQGPLRIVFQAEPPMADAKCPAEERSPVPIVELTVYGVTRWAFGRLALTADLVTHLDRSRV